jgi:hypothetical protein
MALKFHDVKVIEDAHQLLATKQVKFDENYLFVGPISIQDAETWEDRLAKQKTPYVLAQAETTLPIDNGQESAPARYSKGYFIFVGVQDELSRV